MILRILLYIWILFFPFWGLGQVHSDSVSLIDINIIHPFEQKTISVELANYSNNITALKQPENGLIIIKNLYGDTLSKQIIQFNTSDKLNHIQNLKISVDSFTNKWQGFLKNVKGFAVGEYEVIVNNSSNHKYASKIFVVDSFFNKETGIYKEFQNAIQQKKMHLTEKSLEHNVKLYFRKRGKSVKIVYEGEEYKIYVFSDALLEGILFLSKDNKGKINLQQPPLNSIGEFINATTIKQKLKNFNRSSEVRNNILGDLMLQYNYSNQQELGSNYLNNYYDVHANISLPIMGIPVVMNGYYTQQDKNRTLKASYFNINFDKERYKRMLEEYNSELIEIQQVNVTNSFTSEQFYKQKLKNLESELSIYENNLSNVIIDSLKNYQNTLLPEIDQYQEKMNSSNLAIERAQTKFRQYQDSLQYVKSQIERLNKIVEQLNNRKLIDSIEYLSKIEKNKIAALDQKEYLNVVEGLFPNNHIISKLKSINSFNIGAFSNHVSKYTNPGQLTKGASLNYDLKIVDALLQVGRTDLINYSGVKEQFNTGSIGLNFKEWQGNRLGINYFLSMSARQKSGDFSKENTLKSASNIFTIIYDLTRKDFQILIDYSYSKPQNKKMENSINNNILQNSNFNINGAVEIWKEKVSIFTDIEHLGAQFNNEALYYNLKGMLSYSFGIKSLLLKDRVSVNVDYSILQGIEQDRNNKKYGFEIQTFSKIWPKVKLFYKPFTTFSSITDSLNNYSFTMMGSVYGAKFDYKYKRKDFQLFTSCLWNRNLSAYDSVSYNSNIWSLNVIGLYKDFQGLLNFGYTSIHSNLLSEFQIANNNNFFTTLQAGKNVNSQLFIQIGTQLAFQKNIVSRLGGMANLNYIISKWNLTCLMRMSYTKYKYDFMNENIIHASVGLQIPINVALK